jgi:hypothetical protein
MSSKEFESIHFTNQHTPEQDSSLSKQNMGRGITYSEKKPSKEFDDSDMVRSDYA